MPETKSLSLSSLELDGDNPRMPEKQSSTQAAMLLMFGLAAGKMLALAKDIVHHGLDPFANIAVVEDKGARGYVVHEGNRRVAVLKALETPAIVDAALKPGQRKVLRDLSARFHKAPLSEVECKVFDSEDELDHWKRLRHTGMNDGAGLVEWGGDEKDRYNARHTGRSPAGQVLDFLRNMGVTIDSTKSKSGVITSLTRLLGTPEVRERLGITIEKGTVATDLPTDEVVKGLVYTVERLSSGQTKVRDIYTADQRRAFAKAIPEASVPMGSRRMESSYAIDGSGKTSIADPPKKRRLPRRIQALDRKTLIPKSVTFTIGPSRIDRIFYELQTMDIERSTNAIAVLLRVFVELSVDSKLMASNWMSEADRRNKPLAVRMKTVASEMKKLGIVDGALLQAVEKMADDRKFVLSASTPTFNLYVHNQYVHPKPTDLLRSWDELQPFLEKLWL